MSQGLRWLILSALLAWAGCAAGMQLGRRDALLAGLLAAHLVLLAAYRAHRARWYLAALVAAAIGLGAEQGSRITAMPAGNKVCGRIVEMVEGDRGTRLALRNRAGQKAFVMVPTTGQTWLDRFPEGVAPGSLVAISVSPAAPGRRSRQALSARSVRLVEAPGGLARLRAEPARWRQRFVSRARRRLVRNASDRQGLLLLAMVAGEKHALPSQLREDLRASGLAHVAVVSGMHVGLLVASVPLLVGTWAGRRNRSLALGVLAATGLAASLLPGSAPVRRACLAIASAHASHLASRNSEPRAALASAMLLLLAIAPEMSVSWSFSLTVAASLAIVAAAKRPGARGKLLVFCAPVLATWPLLIVMSGRLAPWAGVSNLLALPAVPVALAAGWIQVLLPEHPLGLLVPVEGLARFTSGWICETSRELARWPGSGRLAAPVGWFWVVSHYTGLVALLVGKSAWCRLGGLLVVITWCWPILPIAWPDPPRDGVYVMNVGQGQAILLQDGGRSVLVDAADDRNSSGLRSLLADLRRLGVRRLDGLILSHADRDHAGGAGGVLSALAPGYLALPAAEASAAGFQKLVEAAARRGVPTRHLQRSDRIFTGETLHPPPGRRQAGNAASVVLRANVAGLVVLIPGDADLNTEELFVSQLASGPRVDLLIAGHHGSRMSTGESLLDASRPRLVVFSCGQDNPYGHPHPESLERVRSRGAAIWITARLGGLVAYRRRGALNWSGSTDREFETIPRTGSR